MTVMIQGDQIRAIAGGIKVEKGSGAVANATTDLFTVTGLVVVEAIIGYVTVDLTAAATSIHLNHDPTIGSAANLCAATVVTSDPIGTIYGYLGDNIATLLVSSGTSAPGTAYAPLTPHRNVLTPGVVGMVGTAANPGEILWRLVYWPLSDGASVEAV